MNQCKQQVGFEDTWQILLMGSVISLYLSGVLEDEAMMYLAIANAIMQV
jgi:hypothetical protein